MLISGKGHTDTIQVYSVTVMTHVKALQAGHSSQGTSEPITPGRDSDILNMFKITGLCRVHPGGRLYRALPCRRRVGAGICHVYAGCTVLTPGCIVSLSLPLCPIYAGVYCVGCGLGHGLGRDNHLLARHLLFFSTAVTSVSTVLGVTLA